MYACVRFFGQETSGQNGESGMVVERVKIDKQEERDSQPGIRESV